MAKRKPEHEKPLPYDEKSSVRQTHFLEFSVPQGFYTVRAQDTFIVFIIIIVVPVEESHGIIGDKMKRLHHDGVAAIDFTNSNQTEIIHHMHRHTRGNAHENGQISEALFADGSHSVYSLEFSIWLSVCNHQRAGC